MFKKTKSTSCSQNYIILSVDYEIFGNGSGDVKKHIIEPMNKMIKLSSIFNFPFTIFVEIEEYIAFCKYSNILKDKYLYDPAEMIRQQIKLLVQLGHDIQLHIHPQWYNAVFDGSSWKLNDHFTTVDDLFISQKDVNQYISERKNILEGIIHEVQPDKSVTAYRAGAFCAQPGIKLIAALYENNIIIDSSVVKGLKRKSPFGTFDYQSTFQNGNYWRISSDVAVIDTSGTVFEFPILSIMKRRWNQISLKRMKAKFSKNVPKVRQKEMISELGISYNPIKFLKFLLSPIPLKIDFHNLSANQLLKMLKALLLKMDNDQYSIMVLIGHTKEYVDNYSLESFFHSLKKNNHYIITTFSQIAKLVLKK